MILAVSGWRYFQNEAFVYGQLERQVAMFGEGQVDLRVGCCGTGVDRFVRTWATAYPSLLASFTVYYARWDTLGSMAGPVRNGQMLRGEGNPKDPHPLVHANRLLAIPQPGVKMRSPGSGTVGCILDAHLLGIDLDIPGYKGPA